MKNDIVRFENNVPDNYLIGSRDYQALLRLFTFGINSVKFDVDNIRYINDASHINSRLLNLLKLKVGFFTKEEFQDQYIREVLKVFSLILKKKGTRQAIYDAINLYFRACRYNGDYVVEIINKDAVTPYKVRIGITKESKDILLLEEILKYILPTGYLYEVFKYSTAKYRSNYYSQDILTLSVVDDYNGSNIHDNSSNIFIEKLFEGTSIGPAAICSFSDGAQDAPLKSLTFDIEPVQDLHGYSYPWPAGGGKNIFDFNTFQDKSIEGDGELYNSTTRLLSDIFTVQANNAYLVTYPSSGFIFIGHIEYDDSDVFQSRVLVDQKSGSTQITPTTNRIRLYFSKDPNTETITKDDLATAQVTKGTTPPDKFYPYSNICPISGWTQVKVTRAGINVWDEEWELGVFNNSTGEKIPNSSNIRSTNYIGIKPGKSYAFIKPTASRVFYYGIDKSFISTVVVPANTIVITAPDNAYYLCFQIGGTTYNHDISINYPSTDTAYHAYQGTPITIPLGQTVYGAGVKAVKGKLIITHICETINGLSSLLANGVYVGKSAEAVFTPSYVKAYGTTNFISDQFYVGAAAQRYGSAYGRVNNGKMYFYLPENVGNNTPNIRQWFADNPTQVVYELATPIEMDLAPVSISSQLGQNNIWCNTGDTSLEYLSEKDAGKSITYYNVYNNVTDNYINILTYPSVGDIELYNGDFTVSVSEADFDLDNANMYVLVHQYLKDDRIVCGKTTWSISYDAQTDSITATSGNNEVNISYDNFIRNLPLLEDHEIPSSFTLEYENESINTQGFVLQNDNRSFTFTGYDGNKIIVKYKTDSQYLSKRIDNIVVYKNGWENESN